MKRNAFIVFFVFLIGSLHADSDRFEIRGIFKIGTEVSVSLFDSETQGADWYSVGGDGYQGLQVVAFDSQQKAATIVYQGNEYVLKMSNQSDTQLLETVKASAQQAKSSALTGRISRVQSRSREINKPRKRKKVEAIPSLVKEMIVQRFWEKKGYVGDFKSFPFEDSTDQDSAPAPSKAEVEEILKELVAETRAKRNTEADVVANLIDENRGFSNGRERPHQRLEGRLPGTTSLSDPINSHEFFNGEAPQ